MTDTFFADYSVPGKDVAVTIKTRNTIEIDSEIIAVDPLTFSAFDNPSKGCGIRCRTGNSFLI